MIPRSRSRRASARIFHADCVSAVGEQCVSEPHRTQPIGICLDHGEDGPFGAHELPDGTHVFGDGGAIHFENIEVLEVERSHQKLFRGEYHLSKDMIVMG